MFTLSCGDTRGGVAARGRPYHSGMGESGGATSKNMNCQRNERDEQEDEQENVNGVPSNCGRGSSPRTERARRSVTLQHTCFLPGGDIRLFATVRL
jgi:hypothetical protein